VKRGAKPEDFKTSLTFEEKIVAAWAYYVRGVDQQTLAGIYGVNSGRISDACTSVERALTEEKRVEKTAP
jgi:DNA-binding transcriptional regulator LsrR (DeoR family)